MGRKLFFASRIAGLPFSRPWIGFFLFSILWGGSVYAISSASPQLAQNKAHKENTSATSASSASELRIESPNLEEDMIARAKFGKHVKLSVNKDLFRKGIEIQTTRYGNYFAVLESQDSTGRSAQPSARIQKTQLERTPPWVYGGIRFGGKIADNSHVYMKVGVQSDNHAKGSNLNAPALRQTHTGNYTPALSSGLGVEYQFTGKMAITGEAITNDRNRLSNLVNNNNKDQLSVRGRENLFMFGFHYKLD